MSLQLGIQIAAAFSLAIIATEHPLFAIAFSIPLEGIADELRTNPMPLLSHARTHFFMAGIYTIIGLVLLCIIARTLLPEGRRAGMELLEFQKDTRVTYVSRQQGLPEARQERHFQTVPAGCEYRLIVEYQPRQSLTGLFDRLLVKGSVERAMRKLVQNLDKVFQQRRAEA